MFLLNALWSTSDSPLRMLTQTWGTWKGNTYIVCGILQSISPARWPLAPSKWSGGVTVRRLHRPSSRCLQGLFLASLSQAKGSQGKSDTPLSRDAVWTRRHRGCGPGPHCPMPCQSPSPRGRPGVSFPCRPVSPWPCVSDGGQLAGQPHRGAALWCDDSCVRGRTGTYPESGGDRGIVAKGTFP